MPTMSRSHGALRTLLALAVAGGLTAGALAGCAGGDDPRRAPHRANAGVDWRDQVIYQVLVDRFWNGDSGNDFNVQPGAPARYHGGDWRGLEDKLDYLETLGVTAIWLSPVVRNVEEDAGFASYHGYWTQDFLRANPHFGDIVALRHFVDAAHDRGMLVILDIVTNHVGQLFFYDINNNGQPDDWISGTGVSHTCVQICNNPSTADQCSPDEKTYCKNGLQYLERITEWDPDYDPRGIQGWTSLGFSGAATVRFLDQPWINRNLPPRPPAWFGWPANRPWFDDPSWYNRKGRVYVWWHENDYSREFVREQETSGDFPGGLKDLNTDNPDVQEAMVQVFQYWIDVADVDGFRIDTLKHIDRPELDLNVRGFWGEFATRIRAHAATIGKQNFFMFGEAFDGNDALIGAYTFGGSDERGAFGRLDSVFYFSQKYRVIDEVIKYGGPTRNVECLWAARMGVATTGSFCQDRGFPQGPTYPATPHAPPEQGGIGLAPRQVLVNFLDNHDLARYLFENADVASLHNALFYLFTWDGIPCVYYGTEQRFRGGNDPLNREDMWRGNPQEGFAPFDTQNDTFRYVQALIALRKAHPALRRGEVSLRWTTDRPRGARDSGILAFERTTADPAETVLVIMNTASEQTSTTCAPVAEGGACLATSFAPGTVLTDVAPGGSQRYTVSAQGTLSVNVPARAGLVLVKE
jgi:glycosidase